MSRNGSGTYSLPAGNPVVTGTTISSSWANTTLSDIASALTGSVASDGQTPMTGNLQMGSNKITGLAAGTASTDAANYGQITGGTEAGVFTNVTDSALTSGRVVYASTGGLLASSANLTFNGTTLTTANDASISGLTVGKGAGSVASNTAVGYQSLGSNTSGNNNSSFGYQTLINNTTGGGNSAFGLYAMLLNTTGGSNVAVGQQALACNTTASANTAVGYQAAYTNSTGTSLVAIGAYAGYNYNTSGTEVWASTFVGRNAGYSTSSGHDNTFVGGTAAQSNTTGNYNTALGAAALYSNTTISNQTSVGYQALYTGGGGTDTAVGGLALYAATSSSSDNTAIGYASLTANTTGAYNSALGKRSLQATTTGNYNTALGHSALYSNTTASNNTAVGYQAGYSNTTGTRNTFVGFSAGNLGNGDRNVAVGSYCANNMTTGGYNTCMGDGAGNVISSGSSNTFIGNSAGSAITTGGKNSILGSYTGNQGGVDIRTGSGHIVLSDGDGTPLLWKQADNAWNINYNVGISGNNTLYVNNTSTNGYGIAVLINNSNTTNRYFQGYSSSASAEKIAIYTDGNVRIAAGSTYGNFSDRKLKENIVDATSKLADVCALQVRNFNLKDENQTKCIGFIAQEFETVFPSLVIESEDEVYVDGEKVKTGEVTKGIKESALIPILVKAIQELKAEVDSLKQQLGK